MKLKALIVDDEKDASTALKLLLQKTCTGVEIAHVCESVMEAAKILKKEKMDIVFLDIEMPGSTGFDLLELMERDEVYVIVITAHDEYAIKAIKTGVKDYILKPIDPDELVAAVQEAKRYLFEKRNGHAISPVNLTIPVSTSTGLIILNKEDVVYIRADGRYSELTCSDGKHYTVCKNIGEYEEELKQDKFFRVHKSYLVNCRHVVKINSSDGGFAMMSNSKEIEISKRKKAEFIQFLR